MAKLLIANGGLGAVAENMDNFEALPHLIGVASVVDFERFWGWCTRWQLGDGGVRFPPGPSSDVHLGRLEWMVKSARIITTSPDVTPETDLSHWIKDTKGFKVSSFTRNGEKHG